MPETLCRHFNGYKPCGKNTECSRAACAHYSARGPNILLIHLEALGAVVRSTSLLKAIRRAYPGAQITWITKTPQLLENLEVERVLGLNAEDLLKLSALSFDTALVVDKSMAAAGLLRHTRVNKVRGFVIDAFSGAVIPANREAEELWQLGLSDHLKFNVNQKSEQRLTHEALNLGSYRRDEYEIRLSASERALSAQRRKLWSPMGAPIVGINTGCSETLPNKRLSLEGHRRLIEAVRSHPRLGLLPIVLLGGPEDSERNGSIGEGFGGAVITSPTTRGLRDGLASVAACDLVFTGDSLGMHMAIGLKRWVVAWFGPSCASEIDLYDRGQKILTSVSCSPCWKRVCQQSVMCYDQVDFQAATAALAQGLDWLTSSTKPHFPETFSSPSL